MRGFGGSYLRVKLKDGCTRKYKWELIDFSVVSDMLIIRDKDKSLLLAVPIANVWYYEKVEESRYGN